MDTDALDVLRAIRGDVAAIKADVVELKQRVGQLETATASLARRLDHEASQSRPAPARAAAPREKSAPVKQSFVPVGIAPRHVIAREGRASDDDAERIPVAAGGLGHVRLQ